MRNAIETRFTARSLTPLATSEPSKCTECCDVEQEFIFELQRQCSFLEEKYADAECTSLADYSSFGIPTPSSRACRLESLERTNTDDVQVTTQVLLDIDCVYQRTVGDELEGCRRAD